MGEVYLAQDTRLDRKVAIKLLSARFVGDAEHNLRFMQEARAASALNHPNIITIYDIGEAGEVRYIAAEFIDGQTLRQKIAAGPLPLGEALDYAIQAASALAAAHEAGIVHRDIKPENIMVRADGYVKVVDFGLAKLGERPVKPEDSGTVLMGPAVTTLGTVMGTAQYMSPEQARGQAVDGRIDIFSLGIVLYETIAGRAPFAGETSSHQIVNILERTPPALGQLASGIPPELESVVAKALAKDVDERYQSCAELAADLKEVRRWLEVQSGALPRISAAMPAASAVAAPTARPMDRRAWLAIPIVAGAALAGWFGFRWLYHPAIPFQNYALEELTDSGKVRAAVISPDGRYVVYVQAERGEQSLHIRQVVSGNNLEIQPASKQRYVGLTFSSDGNYLFFARQQPGAALSTLYRISSLGGEPAKVMDGVFSSVSFSPDGGRMAFLGLDSTLTAIQLITARVDGSDALILKTTKSPSVMNTDPVWSPDGKSIATAVISPGASGNRSAPILVAAAGGGERTLGPARWSGILNMAWTPDSKALLAIAVTPGVSTANQIWYVPVAGGEARPLTNDVTNYTSLSSTADGKVLLAVKVALLAGLSIMNAADPSAVQQIASTGPYYTGVQGMAWTPDGKLVYTAKSGSGIDLWLRDAAENATPRRLTSDNAFVLAPQLDAGGKRLFFSSNRSSGVFHVWMMDLAGGELRQVTSGEGEALGSVSSDGKTIYYNRAVASGGIWKAPVDGGEPVQVTARHAGSPAVSPDSRSLAFLFVDEAGGKRARFAVMPAAGGEFTRVFDYAVPAASTVTWTPDGSAITYTAAVAGVTQIWLQPVDGGAARQLTRFTSDSIFAYAWSRDGKRLALSRGSGNADAVLIRQK